MKSLVFFLATFTLLTIGQAHADTIELCGQTVTYSPVVPSKEIPSNISAFSGIWLGKVLVDKTNNPCVAFVVEKVDQNGRAIVHQAFSDVGLTEKKLSGWITWVGQVANGTLVLISPDVSYQVSFGFWSAINTTKLTGSVVDPTGKDSVELSLVSKFK